MSNRPISSLFSKVVFFWFLRGLMGVCVNVLEEFNAHPPETGFFFIKKMMSFVRQNLRGQLQRLLQKLKLSCFTPIPESITLLLA